MYDTMDGVSPYTWPLFLIAVCLGAFFIVNLTLGGRPAPGSCFFSWLPCPIRLDKLSCHCVTTRFLS